MKSGIVLLCCVIMLVGCATGSAVLSGNTSAEVLKQAACSDAKTAYSLAETMLADPATTVDSNATKYWNGYKAGAKAAIDLNCGVSAK